MTEEEVRDLEKAYAELKEQAAQKDGRIEELEVLLMRALLRIEELERGWRRIATTVASHPPATVLDASWASNAKRVPSYRGVNEVTGTLPHASADA